MTPSSARTLFRLLVALILTAIIVWRAHPSAVVAAASRASLGWVAVALGLVLIDRTLMAYRWLVLLRGIRPEQRPSTRAILRVFFISSFIGTFLPPSIGSDVMRAYGLAKERVAVAESVASVLMDRLLGVVSLLIAAVAGLTLVADLFREKAVLAAVALTALACAAGLFAIYSESAARLFTRVAAKMPSDRVRRLSTGLLDAVRAYSSRHAALANVLACSVAVQAIRIAQAYTLGRSLGIDAGWMVYAAFVPLILLVMLLPISIFGLGTSQWAFEGLFSRAGVPSAEAVALSFLFLGLGVLGNLPGALLYITARAGRAASPAP